MLVICGPEPEAETGEACQNLSLLPLDVVIDSKRQAVDSAAGQGRWSHGHGAAVGETVRAFVSVGVV